MRADVAKLLFMVLLGTVWLTIFLVAHFYFGKTLDGYSVCMAYGVVILNNTAEVLWGKR